VRLAEAEGADVEHVRAIITLAVGVLLAPGGAAIWRWIS